MSDLPPTWAETVFSLITADAIQRIPEAEEQFTYIDIGSIDRSSKRIEAPQRLLGADAPSRARKQVRSGDTLVSMTRPNLNAVALVPQELDGQIASTGFDVLRPLEGIDPRWISYLVRTDAFVEAMSDLVQGALYPAVRSKDVRSYQIPLAPPAEQTRIADQLDKLLARIQSCNDRLDAIPALLKRFRKSILTAATLVEAPETGASNNNSVTPLKKALLEVRTGPFGSALHKSDYVFNGLPVINPMHIREGRLVPDPKKTVSELTAARLSEFRLKAGDVVIGRRGEMGRCAVVSEIEDGWLCGTGSMILRPAENLNPYYLQIFLSSPSVVASLEEASVGSTMTNLNQNILLNLKITLPSIGSQLEIVRRVEALSNLADGIEARYVAAHAHTERITPLLLAKAFRGELVPQDPNDEPASVLLERITAEREKAAAQPRARKSSAGRKPVRAPKENATMTKSRQDEDVQGQPYLARHLRLIGGAAPAEALFKASELPVADFYKQLAWEVANGHLRDGKTLLELGDAA